jgi:PleD family two-component response regulator
MVFNWLFKQKIKTDTATKKSEGPVADQKEKQQKKLPLKILVYCQPKQEKILQSFDPKYFAFTFANTKHTIMEELAKPEYSGFLFDGEHAVEEAYNVVKLVREKKKESEYKLILMASQIKRSHWLEFLKLRISDIVTMPLTEQKLKVFFLNCLNSDFS